MTVVADVIGAPLLCPAVDRRNPGAVGLTVVGAGHIACQPHTKGRITMDLAGIIIVVLAIIGLLSLLRGRIA